MFRFFSKIRYQLAAQNRTAKYLRYAIGEVVLVVIGILLALQINTWNQHRKDRINERLLLQNLNEEFIENKRLIKELILHYEQLKNAGFSLMDLMNKSDINNVKINIDSILYNSLAIKEFTPSNAIYYEMLQVGKLRLIQDAELKKLLFTWTRLLESNKKSFEQFEKWDKEQLMIYLKSNVSFKNIDRFSVMAWEVESEFESGIPEIFMDREFENIIDNQLYYINEQLSEYEQIKETIETIISKTNL